MVSEFGNAVEISGYESEEHEEEDEYDYRVEEPLFLELEVLGIVDDHSDVEAGTHSVKDGIKGLDDSLVTVGVALLGKA